MPFLRPTAVSTGTTRFWRTPLAIALQVAVLALLHIPFDDTAWAGTTASATPRVYDIPAGPLADALTRFAQQAGVAIVLDASELQGLHTTGLQGRYATDDGFLRLLHGSGYIVNKTAIGYVLVPAPAATASLPTSPAAAHPPAPLLTLPGVNVVGIAHRYSDLHGRAGTKTDTPVLEVPQSISIIGREQLDVRAVQNLEQAMSYAAGVTTGNYGADTRIDWLTIRGFSPLYYLDGLLVPNSGNFAETAPRLEPFGLDSVEVLKGPASALYGQTAPGGLVDAVSRRPTATSTGEVDLQGGSYDHKQVMADVSGPLDANAHVLARLTTMARDSDTQTDFAKDRRFYVAPALSWRPDDDTMLTLLTHYQLDRDGTALQFLPETGTLTPIPGYGYLPVSTYLGQPDYDRYHKTDYAVGYAFEHRFSKTWSVVQNVRYDDDRLDYHVVVAPFGTPPPTIMRAARIVKEDIDTLAADTHAQADFVTGAIRHKLLLGFDYLRATDDYANGTALAPSLDILDPDYHQVITDPAIKTHTGQAQDQYGLYVQDQARLAQWLLTLTGREDWVDTDVLDHLKGTRSSADDQRFSGRMGLGYLFEAGLAPYISYAQSFQPQIGVNSSTGRAYQPTTGRQVEGGLKYQPADSDLLLTAAAYRITQQNVVTTDPLTQATRQTGEVRIDGFEFEANAKPLPGLMLTAAYTWASSRVTRSADASELGDRLPFTPRSQASVWANYTIRQGTLHGLGFGTGVRYTGASYGDPANHQRTAGYTLADALLRYDWGRWQLALNATNLFDRRYLANCDGSLCYYGNRRDVLATLRYHW